ncbi:MAG: hypothetical protein K2V38_07650, partial [Gemmataceae bacterium]|nr:hypothetical protein [Gemmataceae bacterium]
TWFTWVSRMAPLVHRAWEPLSVGFEPTSSTDTTDRPREWTKTHAHLQQLFQAALGANEQFGGRFCAPVDFMAFVCAVAGQTNAWEDYFDSSSLVTVNSTQVSTFRPHRGHPRQEWECRPEKLELWVQFGGQGDMHDFFACFDLDSPQFGVVAEGEDYHPWMNGPEPLSFRGRNLLHFLTSYLPLNRAGTNWELWPRVPFSEWGTF